MVPRALYVKLEDDELDDDEIIKDIIRSDQIDDIDFIEDFIEKAALEDLEIFMSDSGDLEEYESCTRGKLAILGRLEELQQKESCYPPRQGAVPDGGGPALLLPLWSPSAVPGPRRRTAVRGART